MFADDLFLLVAHQVQEVVVRRFQIARQIEFRHGHGRAHRGKAAVVAGRLDLGVGDVHRVFDDAGDLTVRADDRVVVRSNPDRRAAAGDALELAVVVVAVAQALPHLLIFFGVREFRLAEHAVGAADDFVELIAEQVEEILVRIQHVAFEVEFHGGLAAFDRCDTAHHVGVDRDEAADHHHVVKVVARAVEHDIERHCARVVLEVQVQLRVPALRRRLLDPCDEVFVFAHVVGQHFPDQIVVAVEQVFDRDLVRRDDLAVFGSHLKQDFGFHEKTGRCRLQVGRKFNWHRRASLSVVPAVMARRRSGLLRRLGSLRVAGPINYGRRPPRVERLTDVGETYL